MFKLPPKVVYILIYEIPLSDSVQYLINGKSGISPLMAIRLSKAFGRTTGSWPKQQVHYDL